MAEQWDLSFSLAPQPRDDMRDNHKLFLWLIRTLEHDPHVAEVLVEDHRVTEKNHWANVTVVFVEGHDCPRGSTLHSLDHTHGSKADKVTPPPKTWLERVLDGV